MNVVTVLVLQLPFVEVDDEESIVRLQPPGPVTNRSRRCVGGRYDDENGHGWMVMSGEARSSKRYLKEATLAGFVVA